jgi:hypothetical protein
MLIPFSVRTLQRRCRNLNIQTSRICSLTEDEQVQAVSHQIRTTQSSIVGVRGVQQRLALENNIRIPRSRVTEIMKEIDPVGFIRRTPGAGVRVRRVPMWGVGPWNQIGVDGHDKLRAFGICIYGWRDNFSGFLMHLYMGRTNRNPHVINRETMKMFLKFGNDEVGYIPISIFSDYGTETVESYTTFEVLRQHFGPPADEAPVWVYTQSTHNITVERGWRHWLNERGKEIETKLKASGQYIWFDAHLDKHQASMEAAIYPLVQAELTKYIESNNYARVRYQKEKNLPSGGLRVNWFERPEEYGGQNMKISVPKADLEWHLRRCESQIIRSTIDDWKDLYERHIRENNVVVDWDNCWEVWSGLLEHRL